MLPVPQGYSFAAVSAGFKKSEALDLGIVLSDTPAVAAGVFTTNKFQAAPVLEAREILERTSTVRGLVINSGQANACTGDEGRANCKKSMELVATQLGIAFGELLPASTGVIGAHMYMDKWEQAMPAVGASLPKAGIVDFAKAIMTTDAFPKTAWAEAHVDGKNGSDVVRVFGVAKGAGMICPNMATMLGVVLCDAKVDPELWKRILTEAVDESFNRITVDGDTSTNDTVYALANGASGVEVKEGCEDALAEAVASVCWELANLIVEDAEGGTKTLIVDVVGAKNNAQAELAARAVGTSPLVKTAMYGRDANWGRIVAAVGRSGADFEPLDVVVNLGGVCLFRKGTPEPLDFDSLLAAAMRRKDITIEIVLGDGPGQYLLVASDLTHEYVNINAEYRS